MPREVEVERVGRRSQLLDQPLLEPENRDAPTLKSDPHSVFSSSSRALGTFVAAVGDNLDLMGSNPTGCWTKIISLSSR